MLGNVLFIGDLTSYHSAISLSPHGVRVCLGNTVGSQQSSGGECIFLG